MDIVDVYPTRPLQQLAVEGTVDLPRYSLRYELIKFAMSIDKKKLEQACQDLVARNEVLRTVFVADEGKTLGLVIRDLRVPYAEVAVPEGEDLDAFAHNCVQEEINLPKPHGSSFVGFTLFTSTSTNASTLAFRISHAQYDEICLPLLYDQLSALYADTEVVETLPFTKHVNHVYSTTSQRVFPTGNPFLRARKCLF